MNPRHQEFTAVVLAAGRSRRAAPHNKLLLPFRDSTVVRSTVAAMAGVDFAELLVVTGHQRSAVEAALAGLPVRFVFAEDFAHGMGRSLAAAVRHSSVGTKAWVVTPGDLPHLTTAVVVEIVEQFHRARGKCHVIPTANGQRGHPVVIGSWLRNRLVGLKGDEGARGILAGSSEADHCRFVEIGDPCILRDIDTV